MFSLFPILLAVLACLRRRLVLSVAGCHRARDSAAASTSRGGGTTPWFRGFEVGAGRLLFPWGTPLFDLGFFVAILAAYLASMIESFGDYHAISRIAGGRPGRQDHQPRASAPRASAASSPGCSAGSPRPRTRRTSAWSA
jgi:solute carrier family 23 (nucleobase transporter), member 1